jgi:hypothetical protein
VTRMTPPAMIVRGWRWHADHREQPSAIDRRRKRKSGTAVLASVFRSGERGMGHLDRSGDPGKTSLPPPLREDASGLPKRSSVGQNGLDLIDETYG